MSSLPWLDHSLRFPHPDTALDEPNGLLAAGGDLSEERLLTAYREGIFPWYNDDQPILWWSPQPRCVLPPQDVHLSRSLRKHIRQHPPCLSMNQAFDEVIRHCTRAGSSEGTWITEEMRQAYLALHRSGHAHSVEVWQDGQLIGGLYGLAMGRCFFGESMFSLTPNSSKVAFASLCKQLQRWNYEVIDCQVENPHLLSLGAQCIERPRFLSILSTAVNELPAPHDWQFDADLWPDRLT